MNTKVDDGYINFERVKLKSMKYGNIIRNYLTEEYKWPNATVYYKFEGSFPRSAIRRIKQAMQIISSVSCVRFLSKPSNEIDYVEITSELSGCWSDTGRHSQITQLNLGPECYASVGTPLHELMHTLGFLHQHTRPDRDQYIHVLYENVIQRPEYLFNFEIIEPWTELAFPLPYDFESIMHYSPAMYSREPSRLPTMIPRKIPPVSETIGQRNQLSTLDIIGINFLYCV
ncbi:seminal metalloprotease 1-like [Topomyia yanbarensis]|uniref:seminal metalloprotease 1-like n=1 Tax=Topomyia yanbarensis TaxID=2498891 RepID=UPI00273C0B5E|nr:seminal metalloprotease 1-like [Topomyia yanbarensis]